MYTKMVAVVALLIFFFGAISFLMGLSIATGYIIEPEPGRYLGSKTTGQAIDRGIYYILVAMVMGLLVKISNSVDKLLDKKDKE